MSAHKLHSKSLPANAAPFLIVIVSILLILVATLFPFNFSFQKGFSLTKILGGFIYSSYLTDQIKNILLFLPLGFGLIYWLQKSRLSLIGKIVIVLLCSASLSFLVEVLQCFLPTRRPTPADIFNNTFGGFLGILCFYLWKSKIQVYILKFIEKNKINLSVQQLTAIFIGYLTLPLIISFPLQSLVSLSTWNLNYPLLLGNELTGNRPWKGYVSEVYIADRAITKGEIKKQLASEDSPDNLRNSLLAYYQLNSQDKYSDQTGKMPELTWRGQPRQARKDLGVFLSSRQWLETATPVTLLNERIRGTNQFTLGATFAPAVILQYGPARIVSISSDVDERNLTLGQVGRNLIFRLRTPLSGDNAEYINQIIPNIFNDTKPHRIVVTFANTVLHVYIDRVENAHSFYFLEMVPKADKILYYGLIFIPLGYLLVMIVTAAPRSFIFHFFLYSGILLPSLILEGILALSSSRNINLENLLLSTLITTFTLLIFKLWQSSWSFQRGE